MKVYESCRVAGGHRTVVLPLAFLWRDAPAKVHNSFHNATESDITEVPMLHTHTSAQSSAQVAPNRGLVRSEAARELQSPDLHSTSPRNTFGNQALLRMLDDRASIGENRRSSLHGEPHGKKKSDENGGEGTPDGLKQFTPAKRNEAASGTPVDLATVEKPQQAGWDNGFDEDVAKRFGATRHISLADLGVKIAVDTAKEQRRIRHLIVGVHGNKDMLATGSGDGPDVSDALNLKATNKKTWLPFFSRDKFYGTAQIWLMSCNVGNGPIPQLIADQSGSTVYAYTRTAYATEKSPWAEPKK